MAIASAANAHVVRPRNRSKRSIQSTVKIPHDDNGQAKSPDVPPEKDLEQKEHVEVQRAVIIRRIVLVTPEVLHLVGKPAVDALIEMRRAQVQIPQAQGRLPGERCRLGSRESSRRVIDLGHRSGAAAREGVSMFKQEVFDAREVHAPAGRLSERRSRKDDSAAAVPERKPSRATNRQGCQRWAGPCKNDPVHGWTAKGLLR